MDGWIGDEQIDRIDFTANNLCLWPHIPCKYTSPCFHMDLLKTGSLTQLQDSREEHKILFLGTIRQDCLTLRFVNYLEFLWFCISKFMEALGNVFVISDVGTLKIKERINIVSFLEFSRLPLWLRSGRFYRCLPGA